MRKLRFYFQKYGSSAFVLAFLLSIPLWGLFFSAYSKYELIIADEGVMLKDRVTIWADFNGDGESDYVGGHPWNEGFYAFLCRSITGEVYEQFNLRGKPGRDITKSVFSGDFDGNGLDEFYTLLHRKDSLFLNVIEPYGQGHFVKDRFISNLSNGKAGYDFDINGAQLYDVNNDGKKELAFIISAGFSISPRCVVLYDLVRDELKKSAHLGACIHELRITDLNNDSKPEFLLCDHASGNMHSSMPDIHDHNAYLYVLNENLQPLFKPIVFEGDTQFVQAFPLQFGREHYYCVFNKCDAKFKEVGYWFYLLNFEGEIIKKRYFAHRDMSTYLAVIPQKISEEDGVVVLKGNKHLLTLNQNLDLIELISFEEQVGFVQRGDLNGDSKEEAIFLSRGGGYLYAFRGEYKSFIRTEIKCVPSGLTSSLVVGKYDLPSLYLRSGNQWFDIIYQQVEYYLAKTIGGLVAIYFSMFLLVLFIQKVTAGRDQRQKKMAELQLTSWKNQLDPHFTFNTLNSVGAVILSQERYKAYDFFSKFSKLMRYALEASSKVSVSLEDEIRFIDLYLQLERFRFGDQFSYHIDIDSQVKKRMQVPKMLLQTYVENAVRHGLLDRQKGGELHVKVYKADKNIVFQIEDNGVGREVSSKKENLGNGVGMKVMQEYFSLLNTVNSRPIKVKLLDRNEGDKQYPGTIVYIVLPEGFNYKL